MEINQLDFQKIEYKSEPELSFELIIDGIPVGQLLKTNENEIPHWYFDKEEFSSYYSDFHKKTFHLIGVCSCGESGCGQLGCEVVKEEDFIILENLFNDGFRYKPELKFTFSRGNYNEVIRKMFLFSEKFRAEHDLTGDKL